jgi:hypothetical protein
MATTYDLTTDVGKVRLGIGDTGSGGAWVFTDEEITYFLSVGSTIVGGQIEALRALLTSKSYRIKFANVQGIQYSDTQQVAAIMKALAILGGDMPTIAVSTTGPMDWEIQHFRDGGL